MVHAHTATAAERIEALRNDVNDADEDQDCGRASLHTQVQAVPVPTPTARGVHFLFAFRQEQATVGSVAVVVVGNDACDDSDDAVEMDAEVVHLRCQMHD